MAINKWIDVSEGTPPEYLEKLEVGQILGFKIEDDITHFKIVRIDKKRGKYWAKNVQLYTEKQGRRIMKKMQKGRA